MLLQRFINPSGLLSNLQYHLTQSTPKRQTNPATLRTAQPVSNDQHASDFCTSCGHGPRLRQPSEQTERMGLQPSPPVSRRRPLCRDRWPPRLGNSHSHSHSLNHRPRLCLQPSPPLPWRRQVCFYQRRLVSGDSRSHQHWIRLQPSTLLPQWCILHLNRWLFDFGHSLRTGNYFRLQPSTLLPEQCFLHFHRRIVDSRHTDCAGYNLCLQPGSLLP